MTKIKVAIAGGAGYTAGELLRILLNHPNTEITQVLSNSQSGKYIHEVHPDLLGQTNQKFDSKLEKDFDVIFLCMGHGSSGNFLKENPNCYDKKIIDLSNEFRLSPTSQGFTYGLPEWQRSEIKGKQHIANPGCFATTIQLGLLPAAKAGLLETDIHIHAITGSTGAGQQPKATTHFSWRNNNISVYKAFNHQHLAEIYQSIHGLQGHFDHEIYFVPMRGDFARGIYASIYFKCDLSLEEIQNVYQTYYQDHPFTHISENEIHLKQVVNTNNVFIHLRKELDIVHITSIADNLTKGASGQAVQNMNIIFDLEENTGLNLKANYF